MVSNLNRTNSNPIIWDYEQNHELIAFLDKHRNGMEPISRSSSEENISRTPSRESPLYSFKNKGDSQDNMINHLRTALNKLTSRAPVTSDDSKVTPSNVTSENESENKSYYATITSIFKNLFKSQSNEVSNPSRVMNPKEKEKRDSKIKSREVSNPSRVISPEEKAERDQKKIERQFLQHRLMGNFALTLF